MPGLGASSAPFDAFRECTKVSIVQKTPTWLCVEGGCRRLVNIWQVFDAQLKRYTPGNIEKKTYKESVLEFLPCSDVYCFREDGAVNGKVIVHPAFGTMRDASCDCGVLPAAVNADGVADIPAGAVAITGGSIPEQQQTQSLPKGKGKNTAQGALPKSAKTKEDK